MIRVLVADDEETVRDSIAVILGAQDDIEVVALAADGREAVELSRSLSPDVVVMDLRMPGVDGVAATRMVVAEGRSTPAVLALTTYASDDSAIAAIRAGATGFCAKVDPSAALADAVRTVAAGDSIVSPGVLRALLGRLAGQEASGGIPCSPRELEVLAVVAEGAGNAEIARRLFISEGTVRTHIEHLRDKLDAKTRAQLVVRAHQLGLWPVPAPGTVRPDAAQRGTSGSA